MATDIVFQAVEAFLRANWTTTPLVFENERFPPPAAKTPFVHVEMQSNIWDQKSIGSGDPSKERWDEEGTIWLHVMVPTGSGSTTARQYARQLVLLFRGKTLLSNLTFRSASIGDGQERGGYWAITATLEFINRA